MSFKKFLDAYYTEEYLSGEFTFGFELEGFHTDLSQFKDMVSGFFGSEASNIVSDSSIDNQHGHCPDCNGFGRDDNNHICPTCRGTGAKPTKRQCKGSTFEWPSPVFKFNPSDLSKVIKFFDALNASEQFDVNESCGFHVHINMPNQYNVQEEWFWILCHLAVGDIIDYSVFKKFGEWNFFNEDYASTKFLALIRRHLESKNLDALQGMFDEEKYNVFRIHPQGTLEWRGPRGFILHQDQVKKFFLHTMPMLIKFLAKAQHDPVIKVGSYTYTKQNIFKLISDDARNTEYMFRKNQNAKRKFHYSMTKEKIEECLTKFPWLKNAKCEQLSCYIDPINKKDLFIGKGVWLSGDCYGVIDGDMDWKAPKENFKGFWVAGDINGEYRSIKGASQYFGYDQKQRQMEMFNSIKFTVCNDH